MGKIENLALAGILLLAGCKPAITAPTTSATETEPAISAKSPVIICSAPSGYLGEAQPSNAILMIYFERRDPRDPNIISFEVQPLTGSESFAPNPDGSLEEITIPNQQGRVTFLVSTGVNAFLPLAQTSGGQIIGVELGGCLVDEVERQELQQFFTPGSRFEGQIGRLDRKDNNPFRGDQSVRRQMHASKPFSPSVMIHPQQRRI